jgi:hypothetical protein
MIELQRQSCGIVPRNPTPAELDRIVRHEQSHQALAPEVREQILRELLELERHLLQLTCSSAWVEHCWETGEHFPPLADTTPMRACQCERCQRTGRLWPAHFSASMERSKEGSQQFISYECYLENLSEWDAAMLPSSPSGLALRAVREGRIKIRRQRTMTRSRRYIS